MKKKYRTRFPVARIKKIMQSDEEVGKIALATPIMISKCLELFIRDLTHKTCSTMVPKSNTMTVAHLKQCIENEETFDFLTEIIQNAPISDPEKVERRGRPRKVMNGQGSSDESLDK